MSRPEKGRHGGLDCQQCNHSANTENIVCCWMLTGDLHGWAYKVYKGIVMLLTHVLRVFLFAMVFVSCSYHYASWAEDDVFYRPQKHHSAFERIVDKSCLGVPGFAILNTDLDSAKSGYLKADLDTQVNLFLCADKAGLDDHALALMEIVIARKDKIVPPLLVRLKNSTADHEIGGIIMLVYSFTIDTFVRKQCKEITPGSPSECLILTQDEVKSLISSANRIADESLRLKCLNVLDPLLRR